LSVPVQVIAWRTISEMTCNVSSGTLNFTHSLTHSITLPSSLEYELRPRSHDQELVPKVNSLTESNFLIRQLYKNCY